MLRPRLALAGALTLGLWVTSTAGFAQKLIQPRLSDTLFCRP